MLQVSSLFSQGPNEPSKKKPPFFSCAMTGIYQCFIKARTGTPIPTLDKRISDSPTLGEYTDEQTILQKFLRNKNHNHKRLPLILCTWITFITLCLALSTILLKKSRFSPFKIVRISFLLRHSVLLISSVHSNKFLEPTLRKLILGSR